MSVLILRQAASPLPMAEKNNSQKKEEPLDNELSDKKTNAPQANAETGNVTEEPEAAEETKAFAEESENVEPVAEIVEEAEEPEIAESEVEVTQEGTQAQPNMDDNAPFHMQELVTETNDLAEDGEIAVYEETDAEEADPASKRKIEEKSHTLGLIGLFAVIVFFMIMRMTSMSTIADLAAIVSAYPMCSFFYSYVRLKDKSALLLSFLSFLLFAGSIVLYFWVR